MQLETSCAMRWAARATSPLMPSTSTWLRTPTRPFGRRYPAKVRSSCANLFSQIAALRANAQSEASCHVNAYISAHTSASSESHLERAHGVFVPHQTDAGRVRDRDASFAHVERANEQRISPVLPFEPMRGFGNAHHVRCDLRVQMRRHRNACRAGKRRCAHPSRYAADAHEVRHDEIARAHFDRALHVAYAVEVLA